MVRVAVLTVILSLGVASGVSAGSAGPTGMTQTVEHVALFVAIGTGLLRLVEVRVDQGTTIVDYFDYGVPIAINNPPS